MKRVLFFCLCATTLVGNAQQWRTLELSAGSMKYAFPASMFAGLFGAPIHPLVKVSGTYQWTPGDKHLLLQKVSVGYGYHRFLQSIIPINTAIGYRFQSGRLFAEAFLGAGYLHSIPTSPQYVLNNVVYEATHKLGRAQMMFNLNLGFGYYLKKDTYIAVSYENMLQSPFIKSYVPLLPYNIFNISYAVPMTTFKKLTNTEKAMKGTPKF